MHRFFVEKSQVRENIAHINGDDAKHLEKVLRLKPGDVIEIVVGEEQEYVGEILEVQGKNIGVKLLEPSSMKRESPLKITLYQALPKASKMELIIQKAVELGVRRIVPVMSERCVVQLKNEKDQRKKLERWQKIAYEAAKQSKRLIVPEITLPVTLKDALVNLKEEAQVVAYEEERTSGLKGLSFLMEKTSPLSSIGLWIGPEGGFTKEEINELTRKSVYSVSIGPRILRTETAGLALITMVQYERGDLGG